MQPDNQLPNIRSQHKSLVPEKSVYQLPPIELSQAAIYMPATEESGEELELQSESESIQAPELPAIGLVEEFNQQAGKWNTAITKLNKESYLAAGKPENNYDPDDIDPAITSVHSEKLCRLFAYGVKLLERTLPQYYPTPIPVMSPFETMKREASAASNLLESVNVSESALAAIFKNDPSTIRAGFYAAVKFHLNPETPLPRALEAAGWEFVYDATGAIRGAMSDDAAVGKERSTKTERKESPGKIIKKLNYGRPDEASEKEEEKPQASKAEEDEIQKQEIKKVEAVEKHRSHQAFIQSIRKGKLHSNYGPLTNDFELRLAAVLKDAVAKGEKNPKSVKEDFLDSAVKSAATMLKSWASAALDYYTSRKLKVQFSAAEVRQLVETNSKPFTVYNTIESNTLAIAQMLKHINCEKFLDQKYIARLKRMAPVAETINPEEKTDEVTLAIYNNTRKLAVQKDLLALARKIIKESSEPDIKNARTEAEKNKAALRIAGEILKRRAPQA